MKRTERAEIDNDFQPEEGLNNEYLPSVFCDEVADYTLDLDLSSRDKTVIDLINKSGLSRKFVVMILNGLRDKRFADHLREIAAIIVGSTGRYNHDSVYSDDFLEQVDRHIISKRSGEDVVKITKLVNGMVSEILKSNGIRLADYQYVTDAKIKKLVVYAISISMCCYVSVIKQTAIGKSAA